MTFNSMRITDQELYHKAKLYGENALLWRRKFMGLLPELQRRRIYEKKGFGSIFEFSFKLAGLSEEQVRRILNLEKKFTNLPILKNLLENGEVSVNKLARVASIANLKNESELARQVQFLPKTAIETLLRDQRIMAKEACEQNGNGLAQPLIDAKSVPGHRFEFGQKLTKRLLELQRKGLDTDDILNELLDKREEDIAKEKKDIAANLPERQSRYVPVRTIKILEKEHGGKCSISSCKRPAEHLHHTQTYALSRVHDPHFLAPLCKEHHIIAHSINLRVHEKRVFH